MPRQKAVLVNVAVMAALRNALTYRVPPDVEVRPGQRVLVPLGARRAMGIVLETVGRVAPGMKVREILRLVDPEPDLGLDLVLGGPRRAPVPAVLVHALGAGGSCVALILSRIRV